MKKLITSKSFLLFSVFNLLIAINTFSQQNKGINYQGIARRVNGSPIVEQTISLKLSIKEGSVNGNDVYSEIHIVKTNPFGLFNVVIGSSGASSQIGTFNAIDWKVGNKFLQVEIDPNGGNNFVKMGTSQLQSVPYAIYAEQAVPVGLATGDLSGNYPNPTVNKIQGREISNLSPSVGQILKWDGKSWSPAKDESGTGIEGPKGDKGDPGTNGVNGTDGAPGPKGDKGDPGPKGDKGDPGLKGDKGDPGLKGDKGDPGTNGANGTDGAPGPKGDKGDPGLKGDKGDPGANGTNGTDGAPGPKGDKGDPGINGKTILNGLTSPTVSDGTDGDFFLNTTNYEFFGPKSGGSWPNGINLKNSSGNFVDLSTNQTINGLKKFNSNEGLLALGNVNQGDTLSLGAGTRMMWYPQKAAFRAGLVDGTQWNHYRTGYYSFATGENTIASANSASAMGMNTIASGDYSIALGNSTKASGISAFAMGQAINAPSFGETAFGTFNTIYTPSSIVSNVATDRLFSLGNGTSQGNRSDALIIYKNGNTTINGTLTAAGLSYPNNDGTNGQVLSTNGNGSLSWKTISGSTQFNFAKGTIPFSNGNLSLESSPDLSWDNTKGSFNIVSKNNPNLFIPSLRVYPNPNEPTTPTWMRMGDDVIGAEFGISGGNDQFFIGTVQGDAVIKGFSGNDDKKLFIGAGLNSPANIILSPNGETSIGGTTFLPYPGLPNQVLTTDGSGYAFWADPIGGSGSGLNEFVDLNTDQDIFGLKNFGSDLKVNNLTVGRGSGQSSSNTTLGINALQYNSTGSNLVAIGRNALNRNTIGMFNSAVGHSALGYNTEGFGNTAFGTASLLLNTTGVNNTAIGHFTSYSNTTGSGITTIGAYADVAPDKIITNSTAIGYGSFINTDNTVQLGNTYVTSVKTSGKITSGAITFPNTDGTAGQVLTTDGSGNVSWANQSGSGDSFVDLSSNQTINGNKTFANDLIVNGIKLGHGAGNRPDNFTLGSNSMSKNTDGTYNSAIGVNTLSENTTGSANTAVGYSSLNNNSTGNSNTAFGSSALMNNTSANYNVALGHAALSKNTTGSYNIGIGYAANNENTIGSQNIALGFEAGVISNNLTNTIAIGHQTKARANNQAVIGTGSISEVLMGEGLAVVKGGNYISSSDARLKDNIRTLNYGLKDILLLNPVNFNWKKNSKEDIGFIAQEVRKVIPELVYGIEGDLTKNESLGVNYSQMVSVLTKAIQEQQSQIEDLKQSKTEQKQQIEELKIIINQLMEKRN